MVVAVDASEHLLVYGTLMQGSAHPAARLLEQHARLLGEASFSGRLYSLGWYPGAVRSEGVRDRVFGELFELRRAGRVLDALDRYEGCADESRKPHLYSREIVTARLGDGDEFDAWVYLYARDVSRLLPIPGGRWQGRRR